MASVAADKLAPQEIAQLACTYASLILYDDGQDITAQKLNAVIGAANVKVESFWPKLFAKAIAGQNISDMFNFGGAASGPVSAPAAVASKPAETKADDKKKDDKKKPKEEPKPAEEEEEDVGMGGLFD